MKLLVADIGNTAVKYALYENENLLLVKTTSHQNFTSALRKDIKKFKPAYALFSDVTGTVSAFQKAIKNITVVPANKKLKLPVKNKYKSDTLGQDRLALAAGGTHIFPGKNVLVISAGTCITYDFVNSRGEYYGGSISPGLFMRSKALNHYTVKLPLIKPGGGFILTGNTTQSSILSGVMNGALEEIKGIMALYHHKYRNLKVILTGGDMHFFEPHLKKQIFASRYLTLTGLNSILQLNIREE